MPQTFKSNAREAVLKLLPKKIRPLGKIRTKSKIIKLGVFQKQNLEKEMLTLNKLFAELKDDIDYKGGHTTLWQSLRQIGFK